jgi:hypothetical protein
LAHSVAGQIAKQFSLLKASWFCGLMTTEIPHFGQVTHEHTMQSAMRKLYGALASFVGFIAVRHFFMYHSRSWQYEVGGPGLPPPERRLF